MIFYKVNGGFITVSSLLFKYIYIFFLFDYLIQHLLFFRLCMHKGELIVLRYCIIYSYENVYTQNTKKKQRSTSTFFNIYRCAIFNYFCISLRIVLVNIVDKRRDDGTCLMLYVQLSFSRTLCLHFVRVTVIVVF